MRDKVARLRQLMSEAVPSQPIAESLEAAAARAFQLHEFNARPALVVEQTPRARRERDIERIAIWYGWTSEVVRALDAAGTSSLSALSDDELESLQERMRRLEDCAREGLDCPDALPAR
jgi:hypothetical protein